MGILRERPTDDALRRAALSARAKWSDAAPERVTGRTAGGWPITTNAVVAAVAELPSGDVVGVPEPAAAEYHAIWNVIAARRVRVYPFGPAVPSAVLRRVPPFTSRPPGRGPPFDPAILVDSLPSGRGAGLPPAAGTRPAGCADPGRFRRAHVRPVRRDPAPTCSTTAPCCCTTGRFVVSTLPKGDTRMPLLANMFRSKGSAMTTDYTTTPDADAGTAGAILPAGHDVAGSPTFVPEHLRADYAAIVDVPDGVRLTHRAYLASHLYDEGAAQIERDAIADYMSRYSVDEPTARKYLCGMSGRFVVSAEDSTRLHKMYDVGGTAWPDDAPARIAHSARLELASRAVQARARAVDADNAARCPMCLEVRPAQTLMDNRTSTRDASVTNRVPVPGLPPVRCCGQCAVVIASAAVERIAAYNGAAGMTRGELAAQWLDAQLPAPVGR